MYTALIVIDVLLAVALVVLILLQQGKGADAGAAFGSGSSGTVFGASGGASTLAKITTWLAVAFFAVTLGLSVVAKDRVQSAMQAQRKTSIVEETRPVSGIPEETESGFRPEQIPAQGKAMEIPEADAPLESGTGPGATPGVDDIPTGAER